MSLTTTHIFSWFALFSSVAHGFTVGGRGAAVTAGVRGWLPPGLRSIGTRRKRVVGGGILGSRMEETVFEKDVVEFSITPELREVMQSVGIVVGEGAKTMLGAVIDPQGMSVYPLCVREEDSTELYADSRLEAIDLDPGSVIQVLDVFPSQRPVPSLGGGIGYGAEGIDCWELDGPARGLGQGCFVPIEDTGMGFHQKGW